MVVVGAPRLHRRVVDLTKVKRLKRMAGEGGGTWQLRWRRRKVGLTGDEETSLVVLAVTASAQRNMVHRIRTLAKKVAGKQKQFAGRRATSGMVHQKRKKE